MPWWVAAIIDRLMIEDKLYSIPFGSSYSDRAEKVMDSDNIEDLYRLYADYVQSAKAEAKRRT